MSIDEDFLTRWSRLKSRGASVTHDQATPPTGASPRPALTEADLEGLGKDSDYRVFLADDVGADLRAMALRVLWATNPDLSRCDGLIDYAADYTGDVLCRDDKTS